MVVEGAFEPAVAPCLSGVGRKVPAGFGGCRSTAGGDLGPGGKRSAAAMTKRGSSRKYLACFLVLLALMLPLTASAGVGDIIQLLITITNTLKGEIGQVLGGIQTVANAKQSLQQQVAWPLNAINQAKS